MSISINGETWIPKTTDEYALEWLNGLNTLLAENNITDSSGNIVQLSQTFSNALYLFILAGANRLADNDANLARAINSFNIELCDDQQIENLLPIAAISRNMGSYSTLVLTCTASDDSSCVIPAGARAPFGDVNFVVQSTVTIPAGESINIPTVCDTVGVVSVLVGEVTAFDSPIANLAQVRNNVSSVPGTDAETIDSLRRRIIRGNTIPYSIEGVKTALEELSGINHARVFFNYNTETPMTLPGGIVLQPRTAYIVINGTSEKLAEIYARYMSAPTQNAPDASETGTYTTVLVFVAASPDGAAELPADLQFEFTGVTFEIDEAITIPAGETQSVQFTAKEVGAVIIPSGSITSFSTTVPNVATITNQTSVPGTPRTAYSQDYRTNSGQLINIKYDVSQDVYIFVRVYLETGDNLDSQEIRNQLKRDLIAASASWEIGQVISSLTVGSPIESVTYTKVAYVKVSLDGENWSDRIEVASNAIPRLDQSSISVESLV